MSEPLDRSLIGVALEVDMEDLPEEVRRTVLQALGNEEDNRVWTEVPGLLCACSHSLPVYGVRIIMSCWSSIHGHFDSGLEKFEGEFLPFVLSRFACKAIRVHRLVTSSGVPIIDRWMWWRGSSVSEMHELLLAAHVMGS